MTSSMKANVKDRERSKRRQSEQCQPYALWKAAPSGIATLTLAEG
jgi:hypothetical protein